MSGDKDCDTRDGEHAKLNVSGTQMTSGNCDGVRTPQQQEEI